MSRNILLTNKTGVVRPLWNQIDTDNLINETGVWGEHMDQPDVS